jgi:hypothetical protein
MAALPAGSKCSHTAVYAALLTRLAPCPRTQSEVFKPLLSTHAFAKGNDHEKIKFNRSTMAKRFSFFFCLYVGGSRYRFEHQAVFITALKPWKNKHQGNKKSSPDL